MKNSFDVKIYDKAPFGFVLLRVDPADGGDTVAISIEYANTPFEEMLKIGSLQKGTPFESLFPKPYVKAQKFIALIREVHKTAISREVEYFSTRNRRWFKFSLFSPEPTFIAAIGIDITEEKYLSDLAEEIFQGYDELVHRFCVLGRTTQAALGTYDSTRKVLEIRASTRDGLKPWISETVLSWPLIKSIPGVEVLPLVYSDLLLGAFLFLPKDPIEEKTRALQQRFGAQVAGRLYKESIQATLKKNDEVFRQMSAQVPGFLFSLEIPVHQYHRFTFASERSWDLFEIAPESLLKNAELLSERIHPEDYSEYMHSLMESYQNFEPWEVDFRVLLPEKGERWIRARSQPSKGSDGNIVWRGFMADVTEQKTKDLELSLTRERYFLAIEGGSDGIWDLKVEDMCIYLSPAWQRIGGHSPESLPRNLSSFKNRFHPEDRDTVQATIDSCLKGELSVFEREFRYRHENGSYLWVLARGKTFRTNEGIAYRMAGTLSDVTRRKQNEESIALQARMQSMLVKIATTYIYLPYNEYDATLLSSLADLGSFAKADRAALYTYDLAKKVVRVTHEWCGANTHPQREALQEVPLDTLSPWYESHAKGHKVFIPDIYAEPESRFRHFLENLDIISTLTVPVFEGQTLIGFVGFDSSHGHLHFDEQDEILLTLFARMIGNIHQRYTLEGNLIREKERAEKASQTKSEFLANMSHEIRTPLNSVIGFTDLLKKTNLDETQYQFVTNANTAGKSLLSVINDILDFSKIESGKLELELVKTDLLEVVKQIASTLSFQAAEKNLDFILSIPPDLPRFGIFDSAKLSQVLLNLVGNAIKFTQEGWVELAISFTPMGKKRGIFSFAITDTGIGLAPAQQERLFQPFSQGDSSTNRKYGGSGLGLVISSHLVTKMGGEIDITSALGHGSQFSFALETDYEKEYPELVEVDPSILGILVLDPLEKVRNLLGRFFNYWNIPWDEADSEAKALFLVTENPRWTTIFLSQSFTLDLDGLIQRLKEKSGAPTLEIILLEKHTHQQKNQKYRSLRKPLGYEEVRSIISPSSVETYTPETSLRETQKGKGLKILVAEDSDMNMLLVKTYLRTISKEITVFAAENGKVALENWEKLQPDLILMDVQMPVMDGLEATRRIRHAEYGSGTRVPIAALTAGALKEERERCENAGMDTFLTKPLVLESLQAFLKPFLESPPTSRPTIIHEVIPQLHFDKNLLMDRISGDTELFDQLIELFFDRLPLQLDMVNHAIDQGDVKEIKSLGHAIKGSCLNMAIHRMANLARELEESSGTADSWRTLLAELKTEEKVLRELLLPQKQVGDSISPKPR